MSKHTEKVVTCEICGERFKLELNGTLPRHWNWTKALQPRVDCLGSGTDKWTGKGKGA